MDKDLETALPIVRRFATWGVLAFVLVVGACASFYTVDAGDRAVILRNGAVAGVADPGLNFKVPFIDEVVEFSLRTEKASYEDLASYSQDVQPANITLSVNWHINPSMVAETYLHYGTTPQARILDPAVPKALKEVFGNFQAAGVVRDRTKLGVEVFDKLAALMPPEIVIESIQIENVDFSDAYEKAIELSMQAEAEIKRKQNELNSTKIEAEKTVATAKGDADSQKLRADAAAYTTEVAGKAEASAIAARGAALRDNPALIGLVTAEKWDGKLPTTMLPGSTVPFVGVGQ